MEERESSIAPPSAANLRACLVCKLVKTHQQFYKDGCDNCPFLEMNDDYRLVTECTSKVFYGLISLMNPESSWVSRWQRLVKRKPGCYAIDVEGELPEEIARHIRAHASVGR